MWLPARSSGDIALLIVAIAWITLLSLILIHPIFVTNDSLNNYIHVWYVSDRLWNGHGVPFHMPVLGHGDAFAFPYGFIPWMSAALLRPLFGDWIVTLWLVVGALLLIAATWWAFPELRGGWWTALLLLNPMLVEAPLLGQLAFLWAAVMLFAAMALWRGEHRILAALALGAAQATHAPVILPVAAVLVLARLPWELHRRALISSYALSLLMAAPAAWIILASPSVSDASTRTLLANFFGTVVLRAIVIAAPFIGLVLLRTPFARVPALLFSVLIALNAVLVPVRHNGFAWTALVRSPDHSLDTFIDSRDFTTGATYRILRVGDGKVGMYDLLLAGARLDSEPFPESIDRRSWASTADYVAFLKARRVEVVIIYRAYDRRYGTNEHKLLEQLTGRHGSTACSSRIASNDTFDAYSLNMAHCEELLTPLSAGP